MGSGGLDDVCVPGGSLSCDIEIDKHAGPERSLPAGLWTLGKKTSVPVTE
jgi:hypothetical protein